MGHVRILSNNKMPDAVDKSVVFRRTGKGEQEYKERAPTNRWLALVMIDGRSSVAELERMYPQMPGLAQELAALERDGCILPVRRPKGVAAAATREAGVPADEVEEVDLDFVEEAASAAPAAVPEAAATLPAPAPPVLPPAAPAPAVPRRPAIALGKVLRWMALALVAVVVAGAAALFLMPMDGYAPKVEALASEALGEPVSVRSLRLTLAPMPALQLSGVTIGRTGQVSIGRATAVPTIGSWFSPQKELVRVEIDGVTLLPAAAALLEALAKAKDGPFREVRVQGLVLDMDKTMVGPMSAEMLFRPGAGLSGGRLSAAKGAIDAAVAADRGRLHLDLHAKALEIPGEFPLSFDTASAKIAISADGLAVSEFEATLYEGRARGSGQLSWRDGWQLSSTLSLEGLSLPGVLAVFSPAARWEGRLGGELRYESRGQRFGDLPQEARYEFALRVSKGSMKGANAEAALTNLRTPSRGGETRFDELAAVLVPTATSYQYRKVRLSSGLLKGGGDVEVGRDGKVRGRLAVEIRPKAALGQLPLYVGGTIAEPVLSGIPLP